MTISRTSDGYYICYCNTCSVAGAPTSSLAQATQGYVRGSDGQGRLTHICYLCVQSRNNQFVPPGTNFSAIDARTIEIDNVSQYLERFPVVELYSRLIGLGGRSISPSIQSFSGGSVSRYLLDSRTWADITQAQNVGGALTRDTPSEGELWVEVFFQVHYEWQKPLKME